MSGPAEAGAQDRSKTQWRCMNSSIALDFVIREAKHRTYRDLFTSNGVVFNSDAFLEWKNAYNGRFKITK